MIPRFLFTRDDLFEYNTLQEMRDARNYKIRNMSRKLHIIGRENIFLRLKTWLPINHLSAKKNPVSSRITFQRTYANLLSSNIKQHDEFIKATFSSEKFIETNKHICY